MLIVSQQRRNFTPECRRETANLTIDSGRPDAHAAKGHHVSTRLLGELVRCARENRGASDGISEADLRAENTRLCLELTEAGTH